jgi:hypothetical protein
LPSEPSGRFRAPFRVAAFAAQARRRSITVKNLPQARAPRRAMRESSDKHVRVNANFFLRAVAALQRARRNFTAPVGFALALRYSFLTGVTRRARAHQATKVSKKNSCGPPKIV